MIDRGQESVRSLLLFHFVLSLNSLDIFTFARSCNRSSNKSKT